MALDEILKFILQNIITVIFGGLSLILASYIKRLFKKQDAKDREIELLRESRKKDHMDDFKEIKEVLELNSKANRYVLGDVIKRDIIEILNRGDYRTYSESEHIDDEYAVYSALKGNSVVHDLYIRFTKLKIVPDDFN